MRRSNKDILIGLIQTLSDKKCKDIFFAIQDMDIPNKRNFIRFDKVNLTMEQYSVLLELWGEDKLNKCIEIFNNWLNKLKKIRFMSHYRMLTGWVDDAYKKMYNPREKLMSFDKIDTAWKAKKYIEHIPKELRAYDSGVKYLVERFGTEVLS